MIWIRLLVMRRIPSGASMPKVPLVIRISLVDQYTLVILHVVLDVVSSMH